MKPERQENDFSVEGAMAEGTLLREALASIAVDDTFSEAVVGLRDASCLRFRHRVGERWVKAEAPAGRPAEEASLARQVLASIASFRLNAKHLDVRLDDGSRWEARFTEGSNPTLTSSSFS